MSKVINKLQTCVPSECKPIVDRLLLLCPQVDSKYLKKILGKFCKDLTTLFLQNQESHIDLLLCQASFEPFKTSQVEDRLNITKVSVLVTEYFLASLLEEKPHLEIKLDILSPLIKNLVAWNTSNCSVMLDIILDFIFSPSSAELLVLQFGTYKQLSKLPPSNSLIATNYLFSTEISQYILNSSNPKTQVIAYSSLLSKNKKRSIEKTGNGSFTIPRDESDSKKSKKLQNEEVINSEEAILFMDKVLHISKSKILEAHNLICDMIGIITGSIFRSETKTECLTILTHQFLARTLDPLNPVPSNEQYQELLPRRSSFPRDEFVWKMFSQSTILFRILGIISADPRELCKCIEILKSLIVNLIGYWNIESNSSPGISITVTDSALFLHTSLLLFAMNTAKWLPKPLNYVHEIIKYLTPKEMCTVLLSVWNFIRDYPPQSTQFSYDNNTSNFSRSFGEHPPDLEIYLHPIRRMLTNNMENLCFFYVRFVQ
jgi:hypothetical protein